MEPTTNSALACTNCHAVVTDQKDKDGNPIKVWVCDNCGQENEVPSPDAQSAQAAIDAAAAATTPTEPPKV